MKAPITAIVIFMATVSGAAEKAPDLSAMVVVVGRFGIAHACPTGPKDLYTAAHVTDERPFDEDIALYPLRMQADGLEDLAVPVMTDRAADVAYMHPKAITLLRWFPPVDKPPSVGERLWNVGYRWDSRKEFASPRIVDAKVVRVVAGHVFLDQSAGSGSSGACWVNSKGEAVAIHVWGMDCGPGDSCAGAVGLWGTWRFPAEE